MRYRAFVSSTLEDLKAHRAHGIPSNHEDLVFGEFVTAWDPILPNVGWGVCPLMEGGLEVADGLRRLRIDEPICPFLATLTALNYCID